MSNVSLKNEQTKRKYFKYLKEAEGFSESTIDSMNKAILIYEEFTKHEEFSKKFNPDRMIEFKGWLKNREFRSNKISLVTLYSYFRSLRKFFTWLCWQPGFRNSIKPGVISYLKMNHSEEKLATQYVPRKYPELNHIIKLTDSIVCKTEIDVRDRALIAFTLLTGMRDAAIVSLPLSCIDIDKRIIYQNPQKGVKTKFTKYIESIIFNFDDNLINYVTEWADILNSKNFKGPDPFFPRSKVNQDNINISFDIATEVEPIFWTSAGSIRAIFKKRSNEAGLQYYPPHTYRHTAIGLAFKRCKNGEDLKAVSQNFGHENLSTTIGSYGNYPSEKLNKILNNIDFSGNHKTADKNIKQQLMEIVNKL